MDPAQLNRLAIFGGLSEEECALVGALLEERLYEPGATVVEEGAPGRELYVIHEGHGDVLKRAPDGHEVKIAELGPGACFGEMALVGIMRRSATVRARSALRALVLPYAKVGRLADQHPQTFHHAGHESGARALSPPAARGRDTRGVRPSALAASAVTASGSQKA